MTSPEKSTAAVEVSVNQAVPQKPGTAIALFDKKPTVAQYHGRSFEQKVQCTPKGQGKRDDIRITNVDFRTLVPPEYHELVKATAGGWVVCTVCVSLYGTNINLLGGPSLFNTNLAKQAAIQLKRLGYDTHYLDTWLFELPSKLPSLPWTFTYTGAYGTETYDEIIVNDKALWKGGELLSFSISMAPLRVKEEISDGLSAFIPEEEWGVAKSFLALPQSAPLGPDWEVVQQQHPTCR